MDLTDERASFLVTLPSLFPFLLQLQLETLTLALPDPILSLQHLDSDGECILLSIALSIGVGACVHGILRLLIIEIKYEGVIEALYEVDGVIVDLAEPNRNGFSCILNVLRSK